MQGHDAGVARISPRWLHRIFTTHMVKFPAWKAVHVLFVLPLDIEFDRIAAGQLFHHARQNGRQCVLELHSIEPHFLSDAPQKMKGVKFI